jgi:hypothetical protein
MYQGPILLEENKRTYVVIVDLDHLPLPPDRTYERGYTWEEALVEMPIVSLFPRERIATREDVHAQMQARVRGLRGGQRCRKPR